jgi:hypothetical protein
MPGRRRRVGCHSCGVVSDQPLVAQCVSKVGVEATPASIPGGKTSVDFGGVTMA